MKYLFLLALIVIHYESYCQAKNKFLVVFFVNSFRKDSIHMLLNNKVVSKLRLETDPSTGQCNDLATVELSEARQELTFVEVLSHKKFSTEIQKGAKYLYVFKLEKGNYRFDFSNKLSLPE